MNISEIPFLRQSYYDAISDYDNSVNDAKSTKWDWIVISASNSVQAEYINLQIDRRKREKALPSGTKFAVVPDIEGKRIGSGGATLNILKNIKECENTDFTKLKILVLHSGGDSKRIPQYSVCGKLFAPIPRRLPTGKVSTIFDELLVAFSPIPSRIKSGMLTMSGDTLMLFNPVQIDTQFCDAAGLSIKTSIAVGKEHGVFVADNDGIMTDFLHKVSEERLRKDGAVDTFDKVNVDTGCIWFCGEVVNALWELISCDNILDEGLFHAFVNDKARLSFYADFVSPMAKNITEEMYFQVDAENSINGALLQCRKSIWNKLSRYKFGVVKLHPARYAHFGTTKEFFGLLSNEKSEFWGLGWERGIDCNIDLGTTQTAINTYIDDGVQLPHTFYAENSVIVGNAMIGEHSVLSSVTIQDCVVPARTVLSCIKLKNGKFVCRIFGIDDNPKSSVNTRFLNGTVADLGVSAATIWDVEIFAEEATAHQAVDAALVLYRIMGGSATKEEKHKWERSIRYSFNTSFNEAETGAMDDWRENVEHMVRTDIFIKMLSKGIALGRALDSLEYKGNSAEETVILFKKAKSAEFPLNMRLYHALSAIAKFHKAKVCGLTYEQLDDLAYETVKNEICIDVFAKYSCDSKGFVKTNVTVQLPVRVNFCGSPTDAAPYCLEHGGTMFDGALLLNGKMPIKANVTRLEKREIVLESVDCGCKKTFANISEVSNCGDPHDQFALHKAVLVATGVTYILEQVDCGLSLTTYADIPKGSGLGTSSIVAAACIKAINEAFGLPNDFDRIVAQVFAAEQLMNTGGGWQDQVGGLTNGLKLMRSRPGITQSIRVDNAELSEQTKNELKDRFALIYSGQRRLARNVLREELNRCIENDENTLTAMERIRQICVLMKFELERGDVTKFAGYVTEQFELVKTIDSGASNAYIEFIFESCSDLIDGKSICGAGGGGFLQVILKPKASKEMLIRRIHDIFGDSGVKVWESELI